MSAVEAVPLPESSPAVPISTGTENNVDATQIVGQTPNVSVYARFVNLVSGEVSQLSDTSPDLLIGRHPQSSLTLNDQNISSRHCRIFRDRYSYIIKDTSSNGTFVGGSRLTRDEVRRLRSGDVISFIMADHPKYSFAFVEVSPPIAPTGRLVVASTEGAGAGAGAGPEADTGSKPEGQDKFGDKFQMVRSIGKGNFSEVFLCVERNTGKLLAAKLVDTAKTELFSKRAKSSSIDLESECRLLAAVCHPNIVSFVAMYRHDTKLYIVTEFMDGGDLLTRLIEHGRFDEVQAKPLFRQIAAGLRYLHLDKDITLRDLKPENILLNRDASVAKLADFGLARELKEAVGETASRTYCGTPHYFAPEMFKLQRQEVSSYGKEVDLWSLGVVLYVILSARPPFSDEDLAAQVERGSYDFDSPEFNGVSDLAKDLVTQCMQVDPQKRLTIAQVFDHPWLAEEKETETDREPKRKRARLDEKENADN